MGRAIVLLVCAMVVGLPVARGEAPEKKADQAQAAPAKPTEPAKTEPAAAPFKPDSGDTAWMLVSSALVLLMTIPGLALFYGGLVRTKNVLSVLMQCIAMAALISLQWFLIGYSIAFHEGGVWGGLDWALLRNVDLNKDPYDYAPTIPHQLYMVYQLMFAIITPALICGAFAERVKFGGIVLFLLLWSTFVYDPLAHWVWGKGGWLRNADNNPWGALDFAGGAVVHISSGISALVCALYLGKRRGYLKEPMPPHNMTYSFIGAALLWVGWFGFNAGSAGAANTVAVNAFCATHFATAAAAASWSLAEWMLRGKASALGAISGAVAGLVAITPACGFVTIGSGILIGLIAGAVCFVACTTVKNAFGYDDSLDAFGVHGIGGTLGALLTGVFATKLVNNDGADGLLAGNPGQLVNQLIAVGAAWALAIVGTLVLLTIVNAAVGLRVKEPDEIEGLDLSQHGEAGYHF
jgi:Amt family ammonium transporter